MVWCGHLVLVHILFLLKDVPNNEVLEHELGVLTFLF